MLRGSHSRFWIERPDEFRVVKHFLPHTNMLTADRAIYYGHACFACDVPSDPRRHRTIDDGKSGMISPNVFHYLRNEFPVAKGKANVHNVAAIKRRDQINIHAEDFVVRLNDFKQRLPYLAEANDDYCLAHLGQSLITQNPY
jgi:hypothetical protein